MANITPIFSSSTSTEQQWVEHIGKTLEKQITIDIDHLPASIFHVPETLTSERPEAYTPHRLGLGPLNHFKPKLYKMEQHKLTAVKSLLKTHHILDFQNLVVEKIRALVPVLRSSYDMHLDANDDTLAWIWSIDGAYLFHLLSAYSDGCPAIIYSLETETDEIDFICSDIDSETENEESATREELVFDTNGKQIESRAEEKMERAVNHESREVAKDVLMLENQIPLLVLKEIYECLNIRLPLPGESSGIYNMCLLKSMFRHFSQKHSPLKLSPWICPSVYKMYGQYPDQMVQNDTISISDQFHLLGVLYKMIIANSEVSRKPKPKSAVRKMKEAAAVVETFVPGAKPFVAVIRFIADKLPWDKITDTVKKWFNIEKEALSASEIEIPSASKLGDIAGVKFVAMIRGGIKDIKFDERTRTFSLPIITMNVDLEAILRNLVAYEISMARYGSNLLLTEYVDLMCAMIDTPKDVSLLRDANIIQGELDNKEIVKIFNGISCQSNKQAARPSNIQECISKVNKVFNNMPRAKTYRFMKRLAVILLKILGVLSAIAGVILVIRESYCQFYKCSSFFTMDMESMSTVPSLPMMKAAYYQ